VFHLKKKQLMRENGIFGKCPARVWTIEYQKRGLPHLHLLIFLEDSDRFLEPDVIDEMVCAELDQDGELAGVIQSSMIHGPCGEHNPRRLAWRVHAAPSGIRGTSVRKPR
jgi:helitron helicase-like protein